MAKLLYSADKGAVSKPRRLCIRFPGWRLRRDRKCRQAPRFEVSRSRVLRFVSDVYDRCHNENDDVARRSIKMVTFRHLRHIIHIEKRSYTAIVTHPTIHLKTLSVFSPPLLSLLVKFVVVEGGSCAVLALLRSDAMLLVRDSRFDADSDGVTEPSSFGSHVRLRARCRSSSFSSTETVREDIDCRGPPVLRRPDLRSPTGTAGGEG